MRESQQTPGQYVLTGMQGMGRKHLLLVDPEGVVRWVQRCLGLHVLNKRLLLQD